MAGVAAAATGGMRLGAWLLSVGLLVMIVVAIAEIVDDLWHGPHP